MDPGPIVGVVGQMGGELLDPVLPADGDPGGDGRPDGVRALDLGGGHQGDGHVVGADAPAGGAGQVYQHHLRGGDIIGIGEQLFHQLRAALAHAHGAQGAVAGMAVRA